jgi:hypothetical protein
MKKGQFQASARTTSAVFSSTPVLDAEFPRRKTDTAYDPKWAYALSVLSGWSYAEGQDLVDRIQYHGFAGATVTEVSVQNPALLIVATAYFVLTRDKRVGVLAFRGTEPTSLINWLTDADTTKYVFGQDSGHVHSGFFANVEALWADIVELIDPALRNGMEELYITGHSLGGAMAVVTAARIFESDGDDRYATWKAAVRGVYTYGQPIVGDEAFKATFEPRFGKFLYRHVYDHDVVPCLPPTSVDASFVHFGERRAALTSTDVWNRDPTDRRADVLVLASILEGFLTRRIDAFNGIKASFSIDDHSPRGYIDVSRNSVSGAPRRAVPLTPSRSAIVERLLWKATHLRPLSTRILRS